MDGYLQIFLQQFQHLRIQLEEIKSATNNFDDQNNGIGVGGFGKVYKGEMSHSKGRSMVAIKRLDTKHGQGIPEFLKEITMLSNYKHENLISLLGFCCEGPEMILVYEHASRGSLDRHLNSDNLTWIQRLKICLDAAKGLSYLHDPRETHQRLIHCDVKSANILLDDQLNAKVADFGLSIMGPANEQQSIIVTIAAGTPGYCDPQYAMTHTLTKESDIYSLGVVMFEVLCGKLCCTYAKGRVLQKLVPMWIENYKQKKLNDIIFKNPKIQPLDKRALEIFSDIAYRCLEVSRENRPKMAEVMVQLESALEYQKIIDYEEICSRFLPQFQHLRIPMEEITSATNNFNNQINLIGVDGFGKVYKGEVSHSEGRSMVAIKRLDPTHGQRISQFLEEMKLIFHDLHGNLISLLGFCYKWSELILVYELPFHGSLDRHLSSPHLTWTQRLKICVDASKGLSYLYDLRETHQRPIHYDIKSSNIFLDDQWHAKVSDLGLSIMGSGNEQQSVIITTDPQYAMPHTQNKESDVHSLGVVLFEVLCGTLCCTYSNGRVLQNLVPMWIESYKLKKLDDIIFKNLSIQPLDHLALEIFSDIAYRCLEVSREDQPKMAEVVAELETALENQKIIDYEEMVKSVEPPLNYRSYGELTQLLFKGVLLNGGKTWFSLNKKGERCEMISFASCVLYEKLSKHQNEHNNSRFVGGTYSVESFHSFSTRVVTQFLSPGITYGVNLVFKFMLPIQKEIKGHEHIEVRYGLDYYENSVSYLACERKDGWWMCELYQFTSDDKIVDLEIKFQGFRSKNHKLIEIEGIEFWPLEKMEHYKDEKQPEIILDSEDAGNWEGNLPTDYEHIIKWSNICMDATTKKEVYSFLRKGFLISDVRKVEYDDNEDDDDKQPNIFDSDDAKLEEFFEITNEDLKKLYISSMQWKTENNVYSIIRNGFSIDKKKGPIDEYARLTEDEYVKCLEPTFMWFSLDKNGKKCLMLAASYICSPHIELFSPKTRFPRVVHHDDCEDLLMRAEIHSELVSCQTTYASYLIFKWTKEKSGFETPLKVKDENKDDVWYIYLTSPQTPVLKPTADQNTHNLANIPKLKGLPRQRNDGWMEVLIWEYQTTTTTEMIPIDLRVFGDKWIKGLIIQGIEFRPT